MAVPAAKLGPWGGQGEMNWFFQIDKKKERISKITIHYGEVIESIEFTVVDDVGTVIGNFKLGSSTKELHEVTLGDEEYLTNISGEIGKRQESEFVTSLTFKSNKKTYGPYGPVGSKRFDSELINGSVVTGFFGKRSAHINSIGLYATFI